MHIAAFFVELRADRLILLPTKCAEQLLWLLPCLRSVCLAWEAAVLAWYWAACRFLECLTR